MPLGYCSANHRCEIANTVFNAQIEAGSFCITVDLGCEGYGSTIHTAEHLDPGRSGVRQVQSQSYSLTGYEKDVVLVVQECRFTKHAM